MVDDIAQDVVEISLFLGMFKVNMVRSNLREWWIDTEATRYICSVKGLCMTFEVF